MTDNNFNQILFNATKELADIDDKRKAPTRGGKKYTMVADRVRIFRKHFGIDARIDTSQTYEGDYVRSETTIWVGGEMVANGIAEENRTLGMINKTSAAENAESSSIGRALANLGLQGGEYPTGDELLNALHQQQTPAKTGTKKSDQSTTSNKANSGSSQPGSTLPSGWDELDIGTQVQNFSSAIEKASHPGNLRSIATQYKSWIDTLSEDQKKEITAMYKKKEKEVKT